MKANNNRSSRWLIASIFLVLIVTMTPGNGNFFGNYLDKVVHFMIFLVLSINICYTFHGRAQLIPALLWAMLFGLFTEVVQQFIPGRGMDIYDGIADALGVITGFYLYRWKSDRIDKLLLKLGA